MNIKKYLLAIIALSFLAPNALADEDEYSPQFSACLEKVFATIDIVNCINAEIENQDKRLNTTYKTFMNRLPEYRKQTLRTAQRIWIKYRDANCTFYANPDGGTIHFINSKSCFLKETASRAKELENLNEEDKSENLRRPE